MSQDHLPRIRKWALIVALGLGLYALIGFLAVPWLIRAKLPDLVSRYTGETASVQAVRFNPFAFSLSLRGLALGGDSGAPMVRFDHLYADLGFWESLKGELNLDQITLTEPFVRVEIDRQGRSNFSDLFGRKEPDTGEGARLPLTIDHLAVEEGRLEFTDLSGTTPFRRILFPIRFELSGFTTRVKDRAAPYRLTAAIEPDEALTIAGTLSADPFRSAGTLTVRNLSAATIGEYVQDRIDFAVRRGTLDLAIEYAIDGDLAAVTLRQGTLDLEQLELADKRSNRVLVEVPGAHIQGLAANTSDRRLAVHSVVSTDGRLDTWLTPEGELNLASWFGMASDASPSGNHIRPVPTNGQETSWSVRVDEVTLNRYSVAFEDRRLPQSVNLTVSPIDLTVKNWDSGSDQPVSLTLHTGINDTGQLGVTGTMAPNAGSAELTVDLKRLPLPEVQPYVNQVVRLDVVEGFLSLDGHIALRRTGQSPPVFGYRGNAAVNEFTARLPGANQPLTSWQSLDFSGLDFQSEPARLHIADVVANQLYARVVVRPDRTLNIAQVWAGSKPEKSEVWSGDRAPMAIAVDLIRLENARADFTDRSIVPHFSTGIHDLHGTIAGLNSKPDQSAKLLLEGQVDPYAPVRIEGRLNLFSPTQFADIDMQFTNIDMTALSPYSGKFAGYRIKMGKMSLDLHYQLKDQQLDSQNEIILTHLTLGEPVESPFATDLPLHLAIALLKDSQGRIDLDLPIRGDLSNPEVSFPGLVREVIWGAVRKVVNSPFRLLARLVGGQEEELRYVGFNPGEATLGNEQVAQLSKLANALAERPALYLQVTGVAGPGRDQRALAEQDLITQLKVAKLMEQGRPVDAESIRGTVLSRSEYERLMAELYRDRTGRSPLPNGESAIAAMKEELIQTESVSRVRLRVLAQERAAAIRDYLIRLEGLKPERIFITDVELEKGEGPLVRSELGLRAS